jgi:hypothetical protein
MIVEQYKRILPASTLLSWVVLLKVFIITRTELGNVEQSLVLIR